VLSAEDLRLGAALAAFVLAASVLLLRVQRRAVPTSAAHREAVAGLFADLEEHLTAAEDLRAFLTLRPASAVLLDLGQAARVLVGRARLGEA